MADYVRYRLDDDRTIAMDLAREKLGIEKERWRADVLDAALMHLLESLDNMEDAREDVPPDVIQQFNTSVLKLHYRTSLDAAPDADLASVRRRRNR